MKNLDSVMAAQTERGNKKLRVAKITVALGVVLVAFGFIALGQFESYVIGCAVMGLGWFGVALGSDSWIKAKSIIESASFGIIKLY